MFLSPRSGVRDEKKNPDPGSPTPAVFSSVGDPDPHVLGIPDPDPLVRGTDPDPSLFLIKVLTGLK